MTGAGGVVAITGEWTDHTFPVAGIARIWNSWLVPEVTADVLVELVDDLNDTNDTGRVLTLLWDAPGVEGSGLSIRTSEYGEDLATDRIEVTSRGTYVFDLGYCYEPAPNDDDTERVDSGVE